MTDDSIALRELLEHSADADLLREMIGFAAERLMELDVQGLTCWAEPRAKAIPKTLRKPGQQSRRKPRSKDWRFAYSKFS